MGTHAGAGTSRLADSFAAGADAARQAIAPLGGATATIVFLFTTDRYDQRAVLAGVRSVTGDAAVAGCCTGGVISGAGPSTDAIVVMAIHAPGMRVSSAAERGVAKTPAEAAERAAEQIEPLLPSGAASRQSAVFAFADGLSGTLTDVVRSAAMVTGPLCPLVGGGAGDNLKFVETSQFLNGEVLNDAITVSLVQSESPIGLGVRHGWRPASRPLVVTRSAGNTLYELDGKPAFAVYQELFPEAQLTPERFGEFVMSHPIGIPQAGDEFLIRDPLQVLEGGAIACIANVPEHAIAHIMEGDRASLFSAAQEAARTAIAGLGGARPAAVLVFDCVSRLLMLGEDAATEIGQIQAVIGHETPIAGMFSFGEIAPGQASGIALHNKTVVICAFA